MVHHIISNVQQPEKIVLELLQLGYSVNAEQHSGSFPYRGPHRMSAAKYSFPESMHTFPRQTLAD